MKLAGVLVFLLLLAGALLGGIELGHREAARAGERAAAGLRDSLNVALGEIAVLDAHALRYQRQDDSLASERARLPVPPERTRQAVPAPVTSSASDSAAYWRARYEDERAFGDTLQQDNAALRRSVALADEQLIARGALLAVRETELGVALSALKLARDSLARAMTPRLHGFKLPVLGIRLCPVVGGGFAQLTSGERGLGVMAVQPLRCRK